MDRELAYAAVAVALLGGGLIGFLVGFLTCAWLVEHKRRSWPRRGRIGPQEMGKPNKLDLIRCGHAEARAAVKLWHYSQRMPRGRNLSFAVHENRRLVGAVVFGDSACKDLYRPYALTWQEGCELRRIALGPHETPVTRIVAVALRLLKKDRPQTRLVVSFADPTHGHHGGIYQAGNWIYAGLTDESDEYFVNGRRFHGKALRQTRSTSPLRDLPAKNIVDWASQAIGADVQKIRGGRKHRYLMPLDNETRAGLAHLAQPYPKRVTSIDGDALAIQARESGSIPTVTLLPFGV